MLRCAMLYLNRRNVVPGNFVLNNSASLKEPEKKDKIQVTNSMETVHFTSGRFALHVPLNIQFSQAFISCDFNHLVFK